MVETGCDILSAEACRRLKGDTIGLLANPASVTGDLLHTSGMLVSRGIKLDRLFGPQHGYRGETQANMIEWDGYIHPKLDIPVHSLYGRKREPDASMLEGLDSVVIDLPDAGARPYTYLWTAVLMMRACSANGIHVLILDRPNPIGGDTIEGPMLDEDYRSFVGLYPIPMRHGLTIAEALSMIHEREGLTCKLDVVKMKGWERSMLFSETGLPWVLPSPNIPTQETALVYPGIVMLEGTNISEGRGTTRPFEIAGAPWIDADDFARTLSGYNLDGAVFRPVFFKPTWDKYSGEVCGGVQIHLKDARAFKPVRCGAAVIATASKMYPESFRWKEPPYEYEQTLPPIDIISGGPHLRKAIDSSLGLSELFKSWERDEKRFEEDRSPFLLY